MGKQRNWTATELEFLSEKWGWTPVPAIAQRLKRSENAVIIKAQKLGLGAFLNSGDYVTLNQLMYAVTGSPVHGYHKKSWIKNRGLPVIEKRVNNRKFRVIRIDDFWEWAEKNRSFIDFSKMEPLILGKEPEWVSEQRKKDFKACSLQRKDPWTPQEDSRVKLLLKQQKYGYRELAELLHRTEGAIQKRCSDLGIKDRPIKADPHSRENVWNEEKYDILAEGIRNGDCYAEIARRVGKSEKAVRGKVYVTYLTENADAVRAMIGSGKWGDNAPEPSIRQAMYLSQTKTECKKLLSRLVGLMRYRMNELGYEPYWQRYMCMNWDDYKGCSAGCANCDECTAFIRIKPQYCARCGNEFYERSINKFFSGCRTARKKRAQKRWSMRNMQKVGNL